MPRGKPGGANRRAAAQSMRLEKLYREMQAQRSVASAAHAELARREATPGWASLIYRIQTLDIEEEMEAHELRLLNDARKELGLALFETYPRDGAMHPPQPADTRKPRDDYRNY